MDQGTLVPERALLDLTLTSAERDELGQVAALLADAGRRLIDDREWLTQARELSCRLPLRLREAVRRFRHDPGDDGVMALRNLPVGDPGLPATPTVTESVERTVTVPAAVAVLISLYLGEVVAFRDEKSGALVQNVVPVPGREGSQSNAGSIPLELHVENAFHAHRPDFVGLLCLRNDHSGTAGTLVSSVRRAVRLLPQDVRDVLFQPRFATEPPPSFRAASSLHGRGTVPANESHAVLGGLPDDPNVRVDFHATCALDDTAKAALELLRNAFLEVAASLVLQPGEMAFLDNRIAIHGRTAFTPRYDGRDRWLHRTFVHLDNRRGLAQRVGGGPVIS
ncbi:TauD/TfdA family dioxygenase [Streptomyces coacervatus]|nr:TauD/TfdA family dioxygenase [Streptomyces coacervatus]MDF2267168.1 TauD/TfdA family dioxygenase [Streptomyces coacervatus]